MPIGLFYHAAFTLGCSVLLALFVRYAWPAHLESFGEPPPSLPRE
jgi:hypothetical protein